MYEWFAAPVLSSALAAAFSRLLCTILLREGQTVFAASCVALLFGVMLYLAALQAQGISIVGILRGEKPCHKGEKKVH